MTLIAVVQRVNDKGEKELGLAADLIMSPFRNPSLMRGSKVFTRQDFVWGVTGDVTAIPLLSGEATTFSEFVANMKYNVRENSELIVVYNNRVLIKDLSKPDEAFHDVSMSGEPLGWGCFKYPFNRKFGTYNIIDVNSVVEYIHSIHAIYGFEKCSVNSITAFPSVLTD